MRTVYGNGVWIQICRGALWHYQNAKWKTRCGLDAAVDPHNISKARPFDLGRVCSKCRLWHEGDAALLRDECMSVDLPEDGRTWPSTVTAPTASTAPTWRGRRMARGEGFGQGHQKG